MNIIEKIKCIVLIYETSFKYNLAAKKDIQTDRKNREEKKNFK